MAAITIAERRNCVMSGGLGQTVGRMMDGRED